MVDEYLDTPDLRLLRQGYGLRIRTSGEHQVVTLKSRRIADTASIYRRMEIEEPLAPEATGTATEAVSAVRRSVVRTLRSRSWYPPLI
jgi:inorganic triphosphatase YgiF